jgi:hypothetical protein
MEKKKGFEVQGPVGKTILAAAIVAVGFGLAGCGKQMARIEENQLRLQTMVQANAQEIATVAATIEQNQRELQVGIDDLQNDIRKVAADMAADVTAVAEEQMKLHKTVQSDNRQMTGKMAMIEQKQHELQAGIEDVQNGTLKVATDMAADITVVTNEQTKLYETVQSNSLQLTDKVAVIEQNQQERQDTIESVQQNIQQVAAGVSSLGEDILELQKILQNNIRELVSIVDVAGQEQFKFQGKIQEDLLALGSTVSAIKQSQSRLQSQIEDVQSSAQIMSSDMPAAIEELRDELSRLEPMEIESPPAAPPDEADSVE